LLNRYDGRADQVCFSPTRSFARGVTLVGMSAKKIRRVNQVLRGRSG
jgi:hypothetical protein